MASSGCLAPASAILLCIAVQILILAPGSAAVGSILMSGETLLPGKSLSHGKYHLTMHEDCNLVMYHDKVISWESHTTGMGTKCFLYLQTNGELAIVSEGTPTFIWMSGTGGSLHSFVLVLQPDGNAVVFGTAVWSTGTMRAISSNQTSKSIP